MRRIIVLGVVIGAGVLSLWIVRRGAAEWRSHAALDRGPHLAGVPRRLVVALGRPRNAGAPPHGDQLDREMLQAVVLAGMRRADG